MGECPSCGRKNPDDARFCNACGGALEAVAERGLAQRKVVTVLFCDVAGSTALGERPIRRRCARRCAATSTDAALLERHGGTVEKFVGDAVMAVFGIPRLARGRRAAGGARGGEMRRDAPALGAASARIGVNTGEVVAGEAARRSSPATRSTSPRGSSRRRDRGEIADRRGDPALVRDAVERSRCSRSTLKGKAEPVAAYRLLEIDPAAAGLARRLDAPLVGRERELAPAPAATSRTPSPSRPASCSRCSARPGSASHASSASCLDGGDAADVLAAAASPTARASPTGRSSRSCAQLGPSDRRDDRASIGGAPRRDAARRDAAGSLEAGGAASGRSVVVFDDLHWAEPTFLDLVEHLADCREGRRSCCSASRARSCSTCGRPGAAGS